MSKEYNDAIRALKDNNRDEFNKNNAQSTYLIRSMSDDELNEMANSPWIDNTIYIQEIERRKKESQKEEERQQFAKETESQRVIQINELIGYDEIIELLNMSFLKEAENIELVDLPFENELYSLSKKNDVLTISCSNGKTLRAKVYYDTYTDKNNGKITEKNRTNLAISFSGNNGLIYLYGSTLSNDSPVFDGSDIIKNIWPKSSADEYLQWDFVEKRKDLLFSKTELQFIISEYIKPIHEEQERLMYANEIKRKVLTMPTNEIKKIYENLKENK